MWKQQVAEPLKYHMQKEHYVGDVRHLIWTHDESWPEDLDFDETKSKLEALVSLVEQASPPHDEITSILRRDYALFGVGVGDYTGMRWIALDRFSGYWMLLNSERSSYDETAELATVSFSDARTFFMMNAGLWSESSEFLRQFYNLNDPAHGRFSDSFEGLNTAISSMGGDTTQFTGTLTFGRLKLFSSQGSFCVKDEQSSNACWFKHFDLASKCFLIASFKKHLFEADQHSLFQNQ